MSEKTVGDTQTITRVKPREDVAPPKNFRVIYINDEITTMDFVVSTLMEIFEHSSESAHNLTRQVHEEGSATVAVLPYELAEHKGVEVTVLARANGFPLQVRVEADE